MTRPWLFAHKITPPPGFLTRFLVFPLIFSLALTLPALAGGDSSPISLSISVFHNRTAFAHSDFFATAIITATATHNGVPMPINNGDIAWTVESSSITAPWWGNRSSGAMNGLAWGTVPLSLSAAQGEQASVRGTAPNSDSVALTDIIGLRTVVVKAAMTIKGAAYSQTATVTFGPGPLSVFAGKPQGNMNWAKAATACGGIPGNPKAARYQASTKLPTVRQLRNVAGSGNGGQYGAAHAAGWPEDSYGNSSFYYWTGEGDVVDGDSLAKIVNLYDGINLLLGVLGDYPTVVCLP